MKTGVLYKDTVYGANIGDYFQTLAAQQFFEKTDAYIPLEQTHVYKSDLEQTKVIMNGWYMGNPDNWPPSVDISPLFVSFHITPEAYDKLLDRDGVEYLKKFAPIGCRDVETQEILMYKGVEAYFSACLTLTLGLKYKNQEKSGEIIFADPYYEFHRNVERKLSVVPIGKALWTLLRHYTQVRKISRNIVYYPYVKKERRLLSKIERVLRSACFYRNYSGKFSDELLFKASFVTQKLPPSVTDQRAMRLEIAEGLINRYAKASLVVTSRIHVALPCLGLETPVLFITPDNPAKQINAHSIGRFKGLSDLFRILRYTPNKIVSDDEVLQEIDKIGLDTSITNKDNYKAYQKELFKKCQTFANS